MNIDLPYPPPAERVLLSAATIAARLDALAAEISTFYADKPLTVLAILNGSLVFAADLLRRIPLPLRLECLSVASYHGGTESSGCVTFLQNALPDFAGRHVLILDDILDTGRTLHAVRQRLLAEAAPLSVRVAVLLRKAKLRAQPLDADYVGFDIGDAFVVGYGLDYQGHYRNLPDVRVGSGEKGVRADALGQPGIHRDADAYGANSPMPQPAGIRGTSTGRAGVE